MTTGTKKDFDKQVEEIKAGVQKAIEKMIQKSAINNESVVVGNNDGSYEIVPAKDLLNKKENKPL